MEYKGRKEKARIWMRRVSRFVRKEKREKRIKEEKGGGVVYEDSNSLKSISIVSRVLGFVFSFIKLGMVVSICVEKGVGIYWEWVKVCLWG